MKAMTHRGDDVVWPADGEGRADVRRLARCDVVHVYRRAAEDTRSVLARLGRRGTAITYDNDDDFTAVPRESPNYRRVGGVKGQRIHALTVQVARLADSFSTTTEELTEKYRCAGVENVEVIGNYLAPDTARPAHRHDGLVIGRIAGMD